MDAAPGTRTLASSMGSSNSTPELERRSRIEMEQNKLIFDQCIFAPVKRKRFTRLSHAEANKTHPQTTPSAPWAGAGSCDLGDQTQF